MSELCGVSELMYVRACVSVRICKGDKISQTIFNKSYVDML